MKWLMPIIILCLMGTGCVHTQYEREEEGKRFQHVESIARMSAQARVREMLRASESIGAIYTGITNADKCPLNQPRAEKVTTASSTSPIQLSDRRFDGIYEQYASCIPVTPQFFRVAAQKLTRQHSDDFMMHKGEVTAAGLFSMGEAECRTLMDRYWPGTTCHNLSQDVELQVAAKTAYLMEGVSALRERQLADPLTPEQSLALLYIEAGWSKQLMDKVLSMNNTSLTSQSICGELALAIWNLWQPQFAPLTNDEEKQIQEICSEEVPHWAL